jgi:hypothetical protein
MAVVVGKKRAVLARLYHLSHGQREPVSYWSALSQRRTSLEKQNTDQIAHVLPSE